MSDYDFSTLSSTDFEKLACDLMNAYFSDYNFLGTFKSFKPGRDLGVDILLSSPTNNYEIIGQVKHYSKSSYAKLKYDLLNTEKEKVYKLDPGSYIIITSLELSHQNKIEIKKIFNPYIVSIDHIFGREDLNSILSQNKIIEERHYKLWFSSTIVLNKILNYRFQGRRKEFTSSNLTRKFQIFVLTNDFYKAKSTLSKNKFIILTGEPGVGKTTLSDMIIYDYIRNDFELNIIYDDIKEIEFCLLNDDSKQLFYFDDFLGHTQEEISKSKSAELSMIKIINRIENLENKYLILNTRKFILNSFMQGSERLRNFNPLRSENKIELSSYSYSIKRKILDNHIYNSGLNDSQKNVIKKLAHKISEHENFTPRIVEYFTNSDRVNLSPSELELFVINNLKDPKEIWSHAYKYQITDYDRFLLNTLFSLGGEAKIENLEKAYNSRLDYEVNQNNYLKPLEQYHDSLQLMNDGFIIISDNTPKYISFINPSLEDFLKHRINKNNEEIERILSSSSFIKQWYFFYQPFFSLKDDFCENLSKIFIKQIDKLLISDRNQNQNRLLAVIFMEYFIKGNTSIKINSLKTIDNWKFLDKNDNVQVYIKKFLNFSTNQIVNNFQQEFFYKVLSNEYYLEEFIDLVNLLNKRYNISIYYMFRDEKLLHNNFIKHIKKLFSEYVESKYDFLKNKNEEPDTDQEVLNEIKKNLEFINQNIIDSFSIDYEFIKRKDWNEIAKTNIIENLEKEKVNAKDYDYFVDQMMFQDHEYRDYESNTTLDDLIKDHIAFKRDFLKEMNSNDSQNDFLDNYKNIDDKDILPF